MSLFKLVLLTLWMAGLGTAPAELRTFPDSASPTARAEAVAPQPNQMEELVPGANSWDKPLKAFRGSTLLSTGVAVSSLGSTEFFGLVAYEVSPNLSLFTSSQGGSLMAPSSGGSYERQGLSPLSTLGLAYSGLNLGGWDNAWTAAFTPALARYSSPGPGLQSNAGAQSGAWGLNDGYMVGTSLSRNFGGLSTTFLIRINNNSPLGTRMFSDQAGSAWDPVNYLFR